MLKCLSVLLLVSIFNRVVTVVVYTEDGALNGTVFTTPRGRRVIAFLGVPYAKPPVGSRRFREPQPVEPWEGIRSADSFGSDCLQYSYYHVRSPNPTNGDEDCLYLNIFTPRLSHSAKLNVIFFIHGGGFMFGAGKNVPNYILDNNDFVHVTVNYRLGPFGFLSTEDEVIPGNNGLKDQALALKWVHSNIGRFGGDSKKITIAGLSAGGASVQLHYLSRKTRHLFHRGISVSGSALCPWVLAENSRSKAETLARSVNCSTSDSGLLLQCLQGVPAQNLLLRLEELFTPWFLNPFSPFGVVVEVNHDEAFLSKSPYQLLSEGDVKDAPWLTSMTTEEGLFPAATFIKNTSLLQELEQRWHVIAPFLLDYNNTVPVHLINNVTAQIRKTYFGNKVIGYESRRELIKMMSDRLFNVGIEKAAKLQASATKSSVYFYNFAYRGKYSVSDWFCKCRDDLGVSHADDLIYLLRVGSDDLSPLETEEDRRVVWRMVDLWGSFIQTGEPSVGTDILWSPVPPQGRNISFMLITSSRNLTMSSSDNLGNKAFWDSLPINELSYDRSAQTVNRMHLLCFMMSMVFLILRP
ncbi:carboxylic ester hydrolase activity protein [Homalodisca vitripennis]|nr:carboxylic ester hydrolase activity protein [Homalodisca vitripennis]